jgi:hypothetical protein
VETMGSSIRTRHPAFLAAVVADARRGKSEQRRITG